MTTNEVLGELKKGDEFILGRLNGLRIKNNKKLKSKFVKHNEIMSVSTYVIPETGDTAVVFAVKLLQTLKGKDYSSMYLSYYYKTPYGTNIMPFFDNGVVVGYIEVTRHAEERMKERLGKDFETFFREDWVKKNDSTAAAKEYPYNGNPNEYVAHVGDAFLILEFEDSGRKRIVKTVLATDNLYLNQLKDKLDSKKMGEAFRADLDKFLDADTEARLKMFKKAGMIHKVA